MQNRGVTGVAGLTFVGLPWMHTWGSGRFLGIDRDARHIAETIIDELRHPRRGSPWPAEWMTHDAAIVLAAARLAPHDAVSHRRDATTIRNRIRSTFRHSSQS